MNQYVLDANAVLALFLGEPRGYTVQQLFRAAQVTGTVLAISLLNYGECVYNIERRYGINAALKLQASLHASPLTFYPADEKRVLAAAHIKAHYPLSYADAFAVALAQELQATVVTGDPEFHAVEHLVNVLWLEEPL